MRTTLADINGAELARLEAAGEVETVGKLKIWRDDRGRTPCVKVWRGKARNPLHYYQFKTIGLREQYICRLLDEERQRSEVSARYKAAKAEDPTVRDNVIKTIREALKRRSGKAWSVTGGQGTAWGWIKIDAPPARCTWTDEPLPHNPGGYLPGADNWQEVDSGKPGGHMSPADRAELAALLGLDYMHPDGESVAASHDHYREYIERAEGRAPTKIAQPYWD